MSKAQYRYVQLAIALSWFLLMPAAWALQQPMDVSAEIAGPARRQELLDRRTELSSWRIDLEERLRKHNQEFSRVPADDHERIRRGREQAARLNDEKGRYKTALKEFDDEVSRMVEQAQVERQRLLDEISLQLNLREQQIAELRKFQEGLAGVLRKLPADQNWRREMADWVKESQDAQVGAILASVSLLLGPAGPLEEAITGHRQNAARLLDGYHKNKPKLEEAGRLLRAIAGRAPTGRGERKVYESLKAIDDLLVKRFQSESNAVELLKDLKALAEGVKKAATTIKVAGDVIEPATRNDFYQVLKAAEQAVFDILKAAALDKLVDDLARSGRAKLANQLRLGQWTVDYGFCSFQFMTAWWHVNDILTQIDNRNAVINKLTAQHVGVVNHLKELKGEAESLLKASKLPSEAMRKALSEATTAAEMRKVLGGNRATRQRR